MKHTVIVSLLSAFLAIVGFVAWHDADAQAQAQAQAAVTLRVSQLQIVDARGNMYLWMRIRPAEGKKLAAAEIVFYDGSGRPTAIVDPVSLRDIRSGIIAVNSRISQQGSRGTTSHIDVPSLRDRSAEALERIGDALENQRMEDVSREHQRNLEDSTRR